MIDIGAFPILSLVAFLPLIGAVVVAILPASLARGLYLLEVEGANGTARQKLTKP